MAFSTLPQGTKRVLQRTQYIARQTGESTTETLKKLGIRTDGLRENQDLDRLQEATQDVLTSIQSFLSGLSGIDEQGFLDKSKPMQLEILMRQRLQIDTDVHLLEHAPLLEGSEYLDLTICDSANSLVDGSERLGRPIERHLNQRPIVFKSRKSIQIAWLKLAEQSRNKYFGLPIQKTTEARPVTQHFDAAPPLKTEIRTPGSPPNQSRQRKYVAHQLGGSCFANAVARSLSESSSRKRPIPFQIPNTELFGINLKTPSGNRILAFRYGFNQESFSTTRVGVHPKTSHVTYATLSSRLHGENFEGGDPRVCLDLFCGDTLELVQKEDIKSRLQTATEDTVMVIRGTAPRVPHVISIHAIGGNQFKITDPNGPIGGRPGETVLTLDQIKNHLDGNPQYIYTGSFNFKIGSLIVVKNS